MDEDEANDKEIAGAKQAMIDAEKAKAEEEARE